MGTRKQKPLSEITHNFNLTPLSVLRELVASNGVGKPPVSMLKSNSNSASHKFCPESSDRSITSIGSSSVGATFNSKTVRFRQPPTEVTPTTSPAKEAYSRRQNNENFNKERKACEIDNHTHIEKKKDKGKATVLPLSSSASEKGRDNQNKNSNMSLTDSYKGFQNAAYDHRQTIEKSRKERKSDTIFYHTSVLERKDKGKAIAMPYNSLPIGELKGTQNKVSSSSTLVEGPCMKGLGKLSFSNGSNENAKEADKDNLVSYSHFGKTEKAKASRSSSDCAFEKKSEIRKHITDTSCFSPEKVNYKKQGISDHSRSSNLHIEEKGEEYLSPTSLVGGAKDKSKSVNATNSVPEKTKGKGKVILETSGIRGPSATVAVNSRPSRKTNDKNKNAVGIFSCPPVTRIKKKWNDFDEADDVKYLNSWTDLQAKAKKKCWRSETTSELPKEFVREQKAYFDDIDKYELEVEEVSEDELD